MNADLNCLIEEVVMEVLRKFNVRQFKRLQDINQMIQAARAALPMLGEGSSRIAFAYSGGKVLKIALNEKGFSQNAAEKTVFDNEASRPAVAAIYDFGTLPNGKIAWLISQIVRTIKSKEEFEQLAGFHWETFTDVVNTFAKENAAGDLKAVTSKVSDQISKRVQRLRSTGDETNAKYWEERVKDVQAMERSPFMKGIISAMAVNRLLPGDILEVEHYGKTTDGRMVLLDYGFTEDVAVHYKTTTQKTTQNIRPPGDEVPNGTTNLGMAKTVPQQRPPPPTVQQVPGQQSVANVSQTGQIPTMTNLTARTAAPARRRRTAPQH